MALTPEDVVNKRFNATKFREGYDQDEVDDFLDEVVVELRRLNQENDELRQRLVASESRISELQRGGGSAAALAAPEPVAVVPEPVAAPEPEPVAPEPVAAQPVAEPVAAPSSDLSAESSTNNLLQLARQVHDQHVREGIEKRDALIAEGHATAAKVVSDAQETSRAQLASLSEQKSKLESDIAALESFESEYRGKLKSYIEGQLAELESQPAVIAKPTALSAAAPSQPEPVAEAAPESSVGFSLPPFPDADPAPAAAAPAAVGYDFPAPQADLPGRS